MTNILIIGANGFIGSNLTRGLIKEDNEISTISKIDSDEWRLQDLKKSYKKYSADIINYKKLHDGIFSLEPDVIINCATYGVYPVETDTEKSSGRDYFSFEEGRYSFNEDKLKDIVTISVQNALEKSIATSLVELAVSEIKNNVSGRV